MPEPTTSMKVVVRVRPYNRKEQEQNQRCIIKVMDTSSLLFDPDEEEDEFFFQGSKQHYRDITKRVNKKLAMEYDRVYDTDRTNEDLFRECTAPLVDAVLDGYNCSVFVYGATGAGKTFTMLGSEDCPGLTFLTMRDLFEKIEGKQETNKFDVGVSYLEVYNELVMNLLTKTGPLKLREDAKGVVVSGLTLTPIFSAEELLRMLALGNSNRTQHPTDANAESSRSHAIFQVHIRITNRMTGTKRSVKLSMIDLAGSERAASTQGNGVRFKEGASINKSLLALGNCINNLADGRKHIPYRDSNLTRILKDSLGGNCRTLMVANVSMSSLSYEDTYNTLKYASRAKKIRSVLRQNALKSNLPKEFYVKLVNELTDEKKRITEQVKALEAKLAQCERATDTDCSYDPQELKPWFSRIDAVYANVIKLQQCVIGIRSRIQSLSYQKKLKEDFEQLRQLLTLDQRFLQEHFKYYTSYLTGITNKTQKYTEELPLWRGRLEAACQDLKRLKHEAKVSKYQQILQIYLNSKDKDIQLAKQQMNFNHLTDINNALVENSAVQLKSFATNACNLLHQLYDHLDEVQKLTPDVQSAYERLERKLLFTESEVAKWTQDTELDTLLAEIQTQDHQSTHTADSKSRKRSRPASRYTQTLSHSDFVLHLGVDSCEGSDSDSDTASEVPQTAKKPCILDATQVIAPSTVTKSRVMNHLMVSDMISDQDVCRSANTEKIKQALLKCSKFSSRDLKRTCAQKENLQALSTGYVRKSPRAIISKNLAGSTTFRKPLSRPPGTIGCAGKEAPVVKTNRAASFRIKK